MPEAPKHSPLKVSKPSKPSPLPKAAPSTHKNGSIQKKAKLRAVVINSTVLSTSAPKPETLMTPMEKMELIEDGISKKDLEALKQKTNLDYDQLAQVLSVARATLINKKGKARFSHELSERIVGLADLYSYGYEVFEDRTKFNGWVFQPNQALGGKPPFDLLHNSYGREEVRNVIGRIDYGIYS